nr:MAG TPA: Head fiber protein [Bacteriophage sp.]
MAYTKNVWNDSDLITAEKLNKMEKGIEDAQNPTAYTLPAANKTTLGGVKQAALVAEAAGENVTKAEFKALLDALKAAGQMASK